jgi:hypothetical protein
VGLARMSTESSLPLVAPSKLHSSWKDMDNQTVKQREDTTDDRIDALYSLCCATQSRSVWAGALTCLGDEYERIANPQIRFKNNLASMLPDNLRRGPQRLIAMTLQERRGKGDAEIWWSVV